MTENNFEREQAERLERFKEYMRALLAYQKKIGAGTVARHLGEAIDATGSAHSRVDDPLTMIRDASEQSMQLWEKMRGLLQNGLDLLTREHTKKEKEDYHQSVRDFFADLRKENKNLADRKFLNLLRNIAAGAIQISDDLVRQTQFGPKDVADADELLEELWRDGLLADAKELKEKMKSL